MKKTITQAQKEYDDLVKRNLKRITDIEDKIKQRKEAGRQHADLDQELESARKISEGTETLTKRILDEIIEQEKQNEKEKAEREAAQAAEAEQKAKTTARKAYIKGGGKPEDFESAWSNGLREKVIEKAVLDDDAPKAREPIVKGL